MSSFNLVFVLMCEMAAGHSIAQSTAVDARNRVCREQIETCLQELLANRVGSPNQLGEIVQLAIECQFGSLVSAARNAERDTLLGRHLDAIIFQHAIDAGHIEEAIALVDKITDPDEGRVKIVSAWLDQGEYYKAANVVELIAAPGIRTAEWFRLAEVSARKDETTSDFAMGKGNEGIKLLEKSKTYHNALALTACVLAQLSRQPKKDPFETAGRVCSADHFGGLVDDVYTQLAIALANRNDLPHLEELLFALLNQYSRRQSEADLIPDFAVASSLRPQLAGIGAGLARTNSDVGKALRQLLSPFLLERSLSDRLAGFSDAEMSENLAIAKQAVASDKIFSDELHMEAVTELSRKGDFKSSLSLVPWMHDMRENALIRIAVTAWKKGATSEATSAVGQWMRLPHAFGKRAFEAPEYQELVPVLCALNEREPLRQMLLSSDPLDVYLERSRELSAKGGMEMLWAASQLEAAISLGEAMAACSDLRKAEDVFLAVAAELNKIQLGSLQDNLALRLSKATVSALGANRAIEIEKELPQSPFHSALVNHLCTCFGAAGEKCSAAALIDATANLDARIVARLSFVRGIMSSKQKLP